MFKKRIKNLKEKIPIDILSFVDDRLLISQEKSHNLSLSFLLCSYNIMSKIFLDAGLVMKHSKSEVFHFMRSYHSPNSTINLSSVSSPILTSKLIFGILFQQETNIPLSHLLLYY